MSSKPTSESRRVAFVPFYFAPDVSAISQLFSPLLGRIAEAEQVEVTVFTAMSRYLRSSDAGAIRRPPAVRIERVLTMNLGKRNALTRLLDYLLYYLYVGFRITTSRRFDVVVCLTQPPMMPALLGVLLRLRRLPFVYYVEDLYPELLFDSGLIRRPWLTRKLRRLNEIAFRRAQTVIAIGEYMKQALLRTYTVPAGKIVVIHNWPTIQQSEGPRSLQQPLRFVYSGNLGLAHDLQLLPGLLREVATMGIAVRIDFYGGGRREKEVQQQMSTLSRDVDVRFHGYAPVTDVARNLSEADVLVLAQTRETVGDIVPSKFYSYLSAGRPLVFFGPRESDIGDIVITHDLGWVIESEQGVRAAREGIARMTRSPGLHESVSRGALELAENDFSINRASTQLSRTIQEAAGA